MYCVNECHYKVLPPSLKACDDSHLFSDQSYFSDVNSGLLLQVLYGYIMSENKL